MLRVVVTVLKAGASDGVDLEVPAGIAAHLLAHAIAQCLGQESGEAAGNHAIEARPPGRVLRPDETLSDAGVWDGSWLILR